jgi:preprotein translocase subunit SecF
MRILGDTHLDFLGKRRIAMILSMTLIVCSIGSLLVRGLNFGIEFTGGVVVEAGFPDAADLTRIRSALEEAEFAGAIVQHFGTSRDVTIQIMPRSGVEGGQIGNQVIDVLKTIEPAVVLRRLDFVGPQVGEELAEQGGLATLFSLIMILAYVAFRFQWKFAVGAVAALVHDVMIVLGFFSLTALSFNLSVLAAVLAVIGYSLNDTIVIFDRIRENMLRIRKKTTEDVMNLSLNQTLARTITTSLTTLLVLLALYFMGGEAVYGFSVALIVGILVGTYSSMYVASPVALALDVTAIDLLPPEKEDRELDALP